MYPSLTFVSRLNQQSILNILIHDYNFCLFESNLNICIPFGYQQSIQPVSNSWIRGIREHLCRGGGTCCSPLGNIVPPLKVKPPFFEKNIDTFFNYVNYSIMYVHRHPSILHMFLKNYLYFHRIDAYCMISNTYLHWRQYWLKLF